MYVLGFMGATRRLDHYDSSTGWQPLFVLMLMGGIVIAIGVALQLAQILASFIQKKHLVDTTGDPWDGRTLEWATSSPPPFYNFTVIPEVTTRDAFLEMKQNGIPKPAYEDIHMPKNTAAGIYIAIFAFLVGFAFVWEIVWLAVVSIIGIIVVFIIRGFDEHSEYTLTAAEVQKIEETRMKHTPAPAQSHGEHDDDAEDMSLWELIKVIYSFVWDVIRNKRWRKW
jgi:cytochrome o ubiquinol oxidase subunit 1